MGSPLCIKIGWEQCTAQWWGVRLGLEGSLVQDSKAALYYSVQPRKTGTLGIWQKNCWLGCKSSAQTKILWRTSLSKYILPLSHQYFFILKRMFAFYVYCIHWSSLQHYQSVKWFGSRSTQAFCRPWSGSKLFVKVISKWQKPPLARKEFKLVC